LSALRVTWAIHSPGVRRLEPPVPKRIRQETPHHGSQSAALSRQRAPARPSWRHGRRQNLYSNNVEPATANGRPPAGYVISRRRIIGSLLLSWRISSKAAGRQLPLSRSFSSFNICSAFPVK
jgi:hypothetical protein